jgi:hypothetical protein
VCGFVTWCDCVHRERLHDRIRPQVLDGLPGDRIIKTNTATVSQLLSSCLIFDGEVVNRAWDVSKRGYLF